MHYCIDCNDDPKKNKAHNLRQNLIHLGIALLLLIVTPFILNFINQKTVDFQKFTLNKEQAGNVDFVVARVVQISKETKEVDPATKNEVTNQDLQMEILDGADRGQKILVQNQVYFQTGKKFKLDDKVILNKFFNAEEKVYSYSIQDIYRIDTLLVTFACLFVVVVLLTGIRGLTSFSGLIFSVLILVQFLIPQILNGQNVLLITSIACLIIAVVSIQLAHGLNKSIGIATISTIITICLSAVVSILVVNFNRLSGFSSEEMISLQNSTLTGNLNIKGLLLSGIVIGSLGVLDDVTTAQSTAIEQISKANPNLSSRELFIRGMIVGREHIISLVNTLALAYIGSSLPTMLLLTAYNYAPIWVTINSEFISEEIIRTLVGSFTLLLAVPITTILAARFLKSSGTENSGKRLKEGFSFKN